MVKINKEELTVENNGVVYNMGDLLILSKIFENLCTMEYLLDNYPGDNLSHERAYDIAEKIREEMNNVCTCETDVISSWYTKFLAETPEEKKVS